MSKHPELSQDEDYPEDSDFYVLRLYVTGASINSLRAIVNIKEICDKYIPDSYSLEIIDVYQQKSIAEQEQIIALPLLIKRLPLPEKRLIGDMSDTLKVLNGLGIAI
ncbi:circadian clock KaiB family protein [Dyadobacter sediminis]|uniref:Circadian clock protein KaiB n=1 Tax=Dyadobacter sediminis TaxID=1493691 RepID=A0A5R9KI59_9BACT|nr:circadian clock KaiB family protein [Dyadobacter sediminis]TLU95885.1 circadian clock protein KaiB [Dyadobacter sediminis]GGB77438.1 KaiB 1 [Dyadobacter sediminis]